MTAVKSVSNLRTLIRTDIGCSDSKVFDQDFLKLCPSGKARVCQETNWDPEKRTFFLNEIECVGLLR